jgi:hypothetical protein
LHNAGNDAYATLKCSIGLVRQFMARPSSSGALPVCPRGVVLVAVDTESTTLPSKKKTISEIGVCMLDLDDLPSGDLGVGTLDQVMEPAKTYHAVVQESMHLHNDWGDDHNDVEKAARYDAARFAFEHGITHGDTGHVTQVLPHGPTRGHREYTLAKDSRVIRNDDLKSWFEDIIQLSVCYVSSLLSDVLLTLI